MARQPSKTPRTTVEQLLLAQSIERSLHDLRVPLPEGESVALEVSGFSNSLPFQSAASPTTSGTTSEMQPTNDSLYGSRTDLSFIRDTVAGRLGELGYQVQGRQQDARYLIKILVHALGTEQGESFFGLPPVQSVILPFALPEMTLYRFQTQRGHMRYSLNVYEAASGRFIRSTPWYLGTTYYHQMTILFFFRYTHTDLTFPP